MDCIQGTQHISRQIAHLLGLIPDEAYSRPLPVFNGSTLGQHFRHIFDFYDCLFRSAPSGEVDYAARRRDSRVESDPQYARSLFGLLEQQVQGLEDAQHIQVRADFSTLPGAVRPFVASSVGRELMFAHDHAIHHLALIRIGLAEALPGLQLDEKLGVAPSTLKYRPGPQPAEAANAAGGQP